MSRVFERFFSSSVSPRAAVSSPSRLAAATSSPSFFDTTFNRALVFVRSAAIGLVALWVFRAYRKTSVAILVGALLVGAAGWLFVRDSRTISGYRITVGPTALAVQMPGEPERSFPWEIVEEMRVVGVSWVEVDSGPGSKGEYPWSKLADWKAMELSLSGSETYRLRLDRLSIEQRQTLWRAIARKARLVEQ